MSLPKPPKELIYYLPNGKTVCFDHHLRRCGICCVDFTSGDSNEDDSYAIDDEDDSQGSVLADEEEAEAEEDEIEDEGDRVFVLAGSMARFTPQWDEQVLGPGNTYQIKKDYDSPPKALALLSVPTYYCPTCQLTWLVGEIGEAAARSSRFNLGEQYTSSETPTNQKAELAAVIRALETVRERVLPDRRSMVTVAKGGHDPRAVSDVMGSRLLVVTDSSYIVEGMCRHFSNWKENDADVLVNKARKAVANSEEFLRLKSEVEKLSMVGVQVAYYLVAREDNKEADMLAKRSAV